MERLPLRFTEQKGDRSEHYVECNMGRGREIYGDALYDPSSDGELAQLPIGKEDGPAYTYKLPGGLKIHRSVLTRLEAVGEAGEPHYVPRARYKVKGNELRTWLDWYKDASELDSRRQWEWVE